jgi:glycosyltransferase involved in cell wall biosynthesis
MYFSIIIPVYNRPDEVDELLASLCQQTNKHFEVILAEDGSMEKCDKVAQKYANRLSIIYFEKPNSGPGQTRNAGAEKAKYDYLIFFDSDCIIPPHYIESVSRSLKNRFVDAFGGPDAALPSFTTIQKAINYSMTSFFTTGGIRGGRKSMDKFHPRSFNLGVSRKAFDAIGGYGKMRFGEDIDFSLRLIENGYTTALIPEAFVYHKRRTTFRQFFKQVYNSGIARINLHLAHRGSLKVVHTLPAAFVLGMTAVFLLSFCFPVLLFVPIVYSGIVFFDSLVKNKSLKVAFYSIAAAWIQLFGYGIGFLSAVWRRLILKKGEFKAFEKKFYE